MRIVALRGMGNRHASRDFTRVLAVLTAGLVLMIGMLGHALTTAPTASALTEDEALYISLLTADGIGPTPGHTWNDLIFAGHAIAYDLRNGVNPVDEATTIWLASPNLTRDGAIAVVAAAVVAFAPELVPVYTGESPPEDMVA